MEDIDKMTPDEVKDFIAKQTATLQATGAVRDMLVGAVENPSFSVPQSSLPKTPEEAELFVQRSSAKLIQALELQRSQETLEAITALQDRDIRAKLGKLDPNDIPPAYRRPSFQKNNRQGNNNQSNRRNNRR
jgi:hypothetical protein